MRRSRCVSREYWARAPPFTYIVLSDGVLELDLRPRPRHHLLRRPLLRFVAEDQLQVLVGHRQPLLVRTGVAQFLHVEEAEGQAHDARLVPRCGAAASRRSTASPRPSAARPLAASLPGRRGTCPRTATVASAAQSPQLPP
eukprot:4024793-Prymnesium_polylepis.2